MGALNLYLVHVELLHSYCISKAIYMLLIFCKFLFTIKFFVYFFTGQLCSGVRHTVANGTATIRHNTLPQCNKVDTFELGRCRTETSIQTYVCPVTTGWNVDIGGAGMGFLQEEENSYCKYMN